MADLTVTTTSVATGGDGIIVNGYAGGTITAGQPVQRSTTTGLFTICSDDSAPNAAAYGVALNGAAITQPVAVQTTGTYNPGATAAVGKVYVVSTSGGIAPVDDIAGGEFVTVLGIGVTASSIKLGITASGVAAAGAVS